MKHMIIRGKFALGKSEGIYFIIIIVMNVLVWSGILSSNEGVIIQRDFNFPLSNKAFIKSYFPLWNDLSSQSNTERLPRLALYSPYLFLAQMGLEISVILKILIVSSFTFMSISMFVFCRSLLRYYRMDFRGYQWASLGCAFIFAYVPVSLYFAQSISLLISLGALPLLLYFILIKLNSCYFPLLVTGALLLSLAHPFNLIMNVIIAIVFMVIVRMSRKDFRLILKKLTVTGISFVIIFSWFLLPYFINPVSSIELGRAAHLSPSVFRQVSDNDPIKIALLERDQFTYVKTEPTDFTRNVFHFASLAAIIGIAFSILFAKKARTRMIWILIMLSTGYIICTLLSLGSNGPLGDIYYKSVSESPIGWIFRSPLKFQMYESFFIVSLFSFSIIRITELLRQHNLAPVAGVLIIVILAGSSAYGMYDANAFTFESIKLPSEYFEINHLLNEKDAKFKVLYYPLYDEHSTTWSEGHQIAPFETKSTLLPTYEIFTNHNFVKEILYTYPYSKGLLSSPGYYDLLNSLGIKYIIFHNDRSNLLDQANLKRIMISPDTKLIFAKNNWYLFEILGESKMLVSQANSLAIINDESRLYQLSSPDLLVTFNDDLMRQRIPDEYDNVTKLMENDSIHTTFENLLPNPSFELWENQSPGITPLNWTKYGDASSVSRIINATGADYSLLITTQNEMKGAWSLVLSDEIPVLQGGKYLFFSNLRTNNSLGMQVKIQGFDEINKTWRDLGFVTENLGVSDYGKWHADWTIVTIPTEINKVRYVINSGNVFDEKKGESSTVIDSAGMYELKEREDLSNSHVDYKRVSPTKVVSHLNSTSINSILVFAETYDRGWKLSANGTSINSFPAYGMINGFFLNNKDGTDIVLEYEPQKWFELGLVIATIYTIGFITICLLKNRVSLGISKLRKTIK